ncbi:MAG: hypothetical protein WHT46_10500 [Candidatus Geothermincolales bacterium]
MHWDSLAFVHKTDEDHSFDPKNFLGFIPAVPFNVNKVSDMLLEAGKNEISLKRYRQLYEIIKSILKGDVKETLRREGEENARQILGEINESEYRVDL